MVNNLEIDPALVQEAIQIGKHRTQEEAVKEALKEYIQRRKQARIVDLFGSIEYEDDYDYKQQRQQK